MTLTEEEKKQKNREYQKKYREKNKEKVNEYNRQYRVKNKEKIKQKDKKYREKNKEKIKEYYQKNKQNPEFKEQRKKYDMDYRNTDIVIKSIFKKKWKSRGVKFTDEEFESIWKEYTTQTHCEWCNREFSKKSQMEYKCLDHDHNTGKFRFILCGNCNITRQSD